MKKILFSLLLLSVFLSCKKDCEKDKTATIEFVNTSQTDAVTIRGAGSLSLFTIIDPTEKTTVIYPLCVPGTPCDTGADIWVSYEWEDLDTFLRIGAKLVMCETETVLLVR